MPERIPSTLGASTVSGGYTAGSGLLNVANTAGDDPLFFPTGPTFRVVIQDRITNAVKAVLKVTAINSPTQFAVAADPVSINGDAADNDNVYCVLTADGFSQLLAVSGSVQVNTFPVSAAVISNLNAARFQLVPAPGAGKYLQLISASLRTQPGGTPYSLYGEAGNQFRIFWGAAGDLQATLGLLSINDLLAATVGIVPPEVERGAAALFENVPLMLGYLSIDVSGRIVSIVLNNGGSGYQVGDVGTIGADGGTAAYAVDTVDGSGSILTFHLTSAGINYPALVGEPTSPNGQVLSVAVNSAGLGYAPGDRFTVDDLPVDSPLGATVATVGGAGDVLTVTLDDPGVGYANRTNAPTDNLSGAGVGLTVDLVATGKGFVVDILSIQTVGGGNGTMAATVAWLVVTP